MDEVELRQAIEIPAERAGWKYESGLVEAFLAEVSNEPGALPLLQHALLETWERRRGDTLTFDGYQGSGGVRSAIAQRAELIYSGLNSEAQLVVRRIMLRLTQPGEGTEDTRRRATLDELEISSRGEFITNQVLKALTEARLITVDENSIDVSHEALIRGWPRLREWLDEDRESLRVQHHLADFAKAWKKSNMDESELYRGGRLTRAIEWAEKHIEVMSSLEQEFLEASHALQVNELEESRKVATKLRRSALFLTIALIVVGILALTAFIFNEQSKSEAGRALKAESTAVSAGATAISDRNESERQARIDRARLIVTRGQTIYENDPLSGLRLVLEGLARLPIDETKNRPFVLNSLKEMIGKGRVYKVGEDVQSLYGSPDNSLLIIDHSLTNGQILRSSDASEVATLTGKIRGNLYYGSGVTFSKNGNVFVVDYDNSFPELRRTVDGKILSVLSNSFVENEYYSQFSADDSILYLQYSTGFFEIRDVVDGKVIYSLKSDEVTLSPKRSVIVAKYKDDKVADELRSAKDGSLITRFPAKIQKVTFSSGDEVFVADYFGYDVPAQLRHVSDGSLISNLSSAAIKDYSGIFFSDDGASVVIIYSDNRPDELRRSESGSIVTQFTNPTERVNFSPDSSRVIVAYKDKAFSELLNTADGSLVTRFPDHVSYINFSPDGRVFVAAFETVVSDLRFTSDGKVITKLPEGIARFIYREFVPDSFIFFTNGKIRRVEDGSVLSNLPASLSGVRFSPDNSLLILNYRNLPSEIRNAKDGQILFTFSGSIGGDFEAFRSGGFISFARDGSFFIIGYDNARSEIWEGKKITKLSDLGLSVATVRFDEKMTVTWLQYTDGRTYLIDNYWLKETSGNLDRTVDEDLMRLSCYPFKAGKFNAVSQLSFLEGESMLTCISLPYTFE